MKKYGERDQEAVIEEVRAADASKRDGMVLEEALPAKWIDRVFEDFIRGSGSTRAS